MKTKLFYILFILILSGVFTSCYDYNWKVDHETILNTFDITSSDMSKDITVNYADSIKNLGSEIQLEWEASKAADYSMVFYEVLFYTPDNMETPFYKEITGHGQIEKKLILNEKELNIIAEKAGIAQKGTGSINWKVRASNGVNEAISNSYKTITVSRPAGFAYYPEKMIVAGTGVQESLELKRLKQKEEYTGEYELFFYLTEGNFYLTEKGTNRRIYITQDGELNELFGVEKESLINTAIIPNKIHRVKVNLKTGKAVVVAVESMAIWYSGINDILGEMQQEKVNAPNWSLTKKLSLVSIPGGLDYRYKFRIGEKNMKGESAYSFWGYSTITAPNQGDNTQPTYFYLYEVDNSQSNYCFKFSRISHDQHTLRINVDFSPKVEYFTHQISIIE